MNDSFAIRVDNLSKRYSIGAREEKYKTFREAIVGAFTKPFRILANPHSEIRNPKSELIWALKDVSFEVKRGEVVGIIGRNGAGKTTLLKILSRITEPTVGHADICGRVGSLLEVGTGFHPELTGRENIYLNGAILGMRKREIDSKFDEIVAFAEVDKFIDTPVKHYSSGMYVRLAFAVAAHLEPEILLVDEVLAVGDAAFQKKCLGKMGDVAKEGRTVLFVSHNLGAVSHLCETGLVLEAGEVVYRGSALRAVEFYNHRLLISGNKPDGQQPHIIYDEPENAIKYDFAITKIEVLELTGIPKCIIQTWDDLVLRVCFSCKKSIWLGSVFLELSALDGSKLFLLSTQPDGTMPLPFKTGKQCVECVIEKIPFAAGEYVVGGGLAIPNVEYLWRGQQLGTLTIVARDVYGSGLAPTVSRCLLAIKHHWRVAS